MSRLTINPNEFDEQVWQTKTDFKKKQYQEWLQGVVSMLDDMYNNAEFEDFCAKNRVDLYIIGDLINMLSNIEFNVKERTEND